MGKYRLLITANYDADCILVFEQMFSYNIMIKDGALLAIIKQIMPTMDWDFDDGKDIVNSEYCQYVCYTNKERGEYILASWSNEDITKTL